MVVRDVLRPPAIAPIPLAPAAVEGAMNLRGRIVTAVDLRRRLGLPARAADIHAISIVVEHGGELYGLLADRVGEVAQFDAADRATNPPTLDASWRDISRGVHRHGESLLIVLDTGRVLAMGDAR
jgi:purine-binding chemotaxis protein CheW